MGNSYFSRFGEIIARNGIASIPDAIFSCQRELNLGVGECWFVAQILRHKWTTELPRPSLRKMAAYTGVSERTLHNYKNSLVEKGYLILQNRLDRTGRKDTNYYDFSPLFDAIIEILNSKDNTANPIEEENEELEVEGVSENISDRGVSENFSDSICKFFSGVYENFSEHKQKNIQTEKYINNNNPPKGGKDTRPEAGVVIEENEKDSQPSAGVVVEINKIFQQATGRDKLSFFNMLVLEYGPDAVKKAVMYLKDSLERNEIKNPEGFVVEALRNKWDLETFDYQKFLDIRNKRRLEETQKLLDEIKDTRASPEKAKEYLREIKEKLKGEQKEVL